MKRNRTIVHYYMISDRGSTTAEERGKDIESTFWATYKKVSEEYDNNFLERANDDMSIILTYLFSSIPPNPGDTTNVLILQSA
ncbi:hypothetical protein AZE42_11784 [Rhizopogon vesiculosus]|uniref:Uncharacterized protein n=1 Tax=Rhizopogon vesiculosus TaxID=180088 RepID=A0A1J8PVE9_9AGAM|nr:hypothetical protein AZE42_11784 [Rhizopogon vesiculosus]